MTKEEALKMCLEYIETNALERRFVRWAIKEALAQPDEDAIIIQYHEATIKILEKRIEELTAQPERNRLSVWQETIAGVPVTFESESDAKRLMAYLAQPEQEPVELLLQLRSALALASAICDAVPNRESGHLGTLVNAQPDGSHGYRQIQEAEAALVKYLETPAATLPLPVQPKQEPVARVIDNGTPEGATEWIPFTSRVEPLKTGDLLYTTPPQRTWVGLTDGEILDCDPSEECWGLIEIARTLEAKLKEKNT